MTFTPVDLDSWERRSHYEYYTNLLKCGYSVTVSLDITKLHRQVKEKGLRFYPVFVYCVSRQIAATKEFRMGRDKDGNPGYYDVLHPNYTIFHEDDHTFSDVWTAYTEDFSAFYKNMCSDMETYRHVKAVKAKPGQPQNFYRIFCVYGERNADAVPDYYLRKIYGAGWTADDAVLCEYSSCSGRRISYIHVY